MKKIAFLLFFGILSLVVDAQDFRASALYAVKNIAQPESTSNYLLTFDATTSIYQPEKSIAQENVYYKNIANSSFVASKKWNGKIYLISDALISFDWKIQSETKLISGYNCTKATAQNGQIVAWFTEGIPSNQGPADYFGLPGLILEVTTPKMTISCAKIALLPNTKEAIKAPAQGIKVTQKQFDELIKKK